MYRAHPTHGAGTWPHRTQLKTAARKTTLNTGQCVRQPREGRGRNRQAPPQKKKKEGGRGKSTKTAHSRPTSRQHHHRRPGPPPRKKKKKKGGGTPAEAQANHPPQTGNTKPVTADHGEKGQKKKKKKRATSPARKKGDGGTGTTKPGKKKKKRKEKTKAKKKKNTPRQPSQDGLGTGETRARHTRPHRAPEPETAGGKRGAHETTHVPKADRNRSPTTNTTNSRH